MDTADWAQEAESFLRLYHTFLLKEDADIPSQFFPEFENPKQAVATVLENPQLKDLNFRNLQSGPFELLETTRGWQPILRRLPAVHDSRLLTLTRRDLLKSVKEPDNLFLVSRQQWALLECLRFTNGMYQDPQVLQVLQQDFGGDRSNNNNLQEPTTTSHDLKIVESEHAGRYVRLESRAASPGDILYSAVPFVTAPYAFSPHAACFHCGKDLSNAPPTNTSSALSSVRNLALQCSNCQVSSLSYCTVSCRQQHQALHDRECAWIPLFTRRADFPKDRMMPFKALLVLRATLQAKTRPSEFQQLLQLQTHSQEHEEHHPGYANMARSLAQWMVDDILTDDDISTIAQQVSQQQGRPTTTTTTREDKNKKQIAVDCLVNIFFAIHINAISLGPHAVGLFPGMPSMLNHSCNENVTHSWDRDDNADNANANTTNDANVLNFRAVEAMAAGDECCIAYVDELHLPTQERTKPLATYKLFTCQCPRCTSPDEQGRLQAMTEWRNLTEKLTTTTTTASDEEAAAQNESSEWAVSSLRRRCELAEILYPTNFVSKGLAMEELAHALMDSKDVDLKKEAIEWLEKAKMQYTTCRGESSMFVDRVRQAIATAQQGPGEDPEDGQPQQQQQEEQEEDIGDADLILAEGWHQVLLEIKTYETLDDAGLEQLSDTIKTAMPDETVIRWASGYRAYEIGYGIRSLILSCRINMSVQDKEEIAELLEEKFEDDIQHVDLMTNTL
jgi:translation elongation factor EF-1beta